MKLEEAAVQVELGSQRRAEGEEQHSGSDAGRTQGRGQ